MEPIEASLRLASLLRDYADDLDALVEFALRAPGGEGWTIRWGAEIGQDEHGEDMGGKHGDEMPFVRLFAPPDVALPDVLDDIRELAAKIKCHPGWTFGLFAGDKVTKSEIYFPWT